jgi:hypothetical protein
MHDVDGDTMRLEVGCHNLSHRVKKATLGAYFESESSLGNRAQRCDRDGEEQDNDGDSSPLRGDPHEYSAS